MEMNETPKANRIRIAFFGLRNAGKSTLVNAFTGQEVAIVSEVAGTTTDPVSKAMEILPLGPCLITDTAGLDDVGELGEMRVKKTLDVLATTDVAVWVWGRDSSRASDWYGRFLSECKARNVAVLEYARGDSVEALKAKVASLKLADDTPGLLEGLACDDVICVCPIDEAAPKGRLILPQVQVLRACLDRHLTCSVCQPEEFPALLARRSGDGRPSQRGGTLVITDSQAFAEVDAAIRAADDATVSLTSFSILFARQKGDLDEFRRGIAAIANLKDGDTVLVAEGCTHHRQCNDIGTTKIPKALEKLSGKKLNFVFASGNDFPDLGPAPADDVHASTPRQPKVSLVVQCGGCMLTRREMLRRIARAKAAGVPIANYGLVLRVMI